MQGCIHENDLTARGYRKERGWLEQRHGAKHDPDGGEDGRLSGGRPPARCGR
jgi:hypothetical protein